MLSREGSEKISAFYANGQEDEQQEYAAKESLPMWRKTANDSNK